MNNRYMYFISTWVCIVALSDANAQTANSYPITGETVIGNHFHAGNTNELWTDASALYFNYRGSGAATHFWNLGGSTGKSILSLLNTGKVGIGTSTPQTALDVSGELRLDRIGAFPPEGSIAENAWGNYIIGDVNTGQRLRLGVSNDQYTRAEIDINNGNQQYGTISFNTANGSGGASRRMFIDGNGSVGIGTTVPDTRLTVNGTVGIGNMSGTNSSGMKVEYTDGGSGTTVFKHQRWGGDIFFKRDGNAGERTQFRFGGSSSHAMDIYDGNNTVTVRINSGGDSYLMGGLVGIGTNTPDKTLTVKGTIHTNEVQVDMNAPIQGPDYVFEKDYNLLPLSEVESYIKQNKHLPEVPSAKEMEQDGLNLKEMNLLLLKKVEELTLHVIELKKENETQFKKMSMQQAEIEKLKRRID